MASLNDVKTRYAGTGFRDELPDSLRSARDIDMIERMIVKLGLRCLHNPGRVAGRTCCSKNSSMVGAEMNG